MQSQISRMVDKSICSKEVIFYTKTQWCQWLVGGYVVTTKVIFKAFPREVDYIWIIKNLLVIIPACDVLSIGDRPEDDQSDQ